MGESRVLPVVLLTVGAACGGAAVALATVGLTMFRADDPGVTQLNASAISLALIGAVAAIVTAQLRRHGARTSR